MKLKPLIAAVLLGGLVWHAHAGITRAEFVLDQIPALSSRDTQLPVGMTPVGQWLNDNGSGVILEGYSSEFGGADRSSTGSVAAGIPFGSHSASLPANAIRQSSAEAQFRPGGMSGSVSVEPTWATEAAEARLQWIRGFQLDPHSEVSFSGFASIHIPDDANPQLKSLSYEANYSPWNPDEVHVKVSNSDTNIRFLLRIDDPLAQLDPSLSRNVLHALEAVSFNVGSDGHVLLKVNNTADTPLYAALFMDIDIYASAPSIPEPHIYLTLLGGLGWMTMMGRRRHQPAAWAVC